MGTMLCWVLCHALIFVFHLQLSIVVLRSREMCFRDFLVAIHAIFKHQISLITTFAKFYLEPSISPS